MRNAIGITVLVIGCITLFFSILCTVVPFDLNSVGAQSLTYSDSTTLIQSLRNIFLPIMSIPFIGGLFNASMAQPSMGFIVGIMTILGGIIIVFDKDIFSKT